MNILITYFSQSNNTKKVAEAIGAGACAIAAYDQQKADALVRVDGDEEFVVYLAAVGKL